MQINTRRAESDGPTETLDGVLPKEYMRGEIGGISLFTRMPYIEIEAIEMSIKELEAKEGVNDE